MVALAVLLLVCAAVLAYVVAMYRRDSVELPRGLNWLLTGAPLAGVRRGAVLLLQSGKRTERQLVKNSRVVLLVDTSQSMGLRDAEASGAAEGPPRIQRVVDELSRRQLLADLRAKHDVVVYRFDQDPRPIGGRLAAQAGAAGARRMRSTAEEEAGSAVARRDADRC